MTDRFYPVGLEAVEDAFKTTYEIANEMRSYPRSDFPPGTSVHLPGTMDKFGYSNPGPILSRLTKKKDYEKTAGRSLAESFNSNGNASPVGGAGGTRGSPSIGGGGSAVQAFRKTRSLPSLTKTPVASRIAEPPAPCTRLEDEHFSYFVPKSMHSLGEAKLNPLLMSKLHKTDRVTFPFSGEGTGFRTQSGLTEVFPQGHYKDVSTTTKLAFTKPPIVRLSPLDLH